MAKMKIKPGIDFKTPAKGLLTVALLLLAFVFFCELVIIIVRFLAG